MTEFTHAVIDLDPIKYAVASVGEKKSIIVTNRATLESHKFKTRTEFWGHWKKKAGGKLAEWNAELSDDAKLMPEDFDITDVVEPGPIEHVLHTAKNFTDDILRESGCKTYSALIGSGDSWRVDASTLLKYKGNRDEVVKPYHYDAVVEYLTTRYNAEKVVGLEVDDRLVIDTYGKKGAFAIAKEKDIYSSAMYFFDYTKPEKGIQNGNVFGELYLNDKKEVKGIGRKHFMWQVCSQDDSDNYKANCFSDIEWGAMSAYKALEAAQNDKELFTAAYDVFKHLYPEKRIVTGWRGDEIEIDALYVFQEMFTMAWMLRHENDKPNVRETLTKMGII
ncbi:hypothetical protein PMW_219 [Pseudomonas phage phiPMW]|uniref:Uncharacterized protein n=1 Tax=Pseudomonas phage phiPMW TaxID=1815582 RepID=A0A1S5R1S1_9CAUD|nr:hypothetical protein FDG97_gp131 [Pseudomonas phage phiPMW]ANA49344.1 hypothetical protein PMW_219 [Pseudomonas phage phiPMW]